MAAINYKINYGFDLNLEVAGIGGGGGVIDEKPVAPHIVCCVKQELVAENMKPKKLWKKKFGGIGLALVTSVLVSMVLVMSKLLQNAGYPAAETAFWRHSGVLLPSILLITYFEVGGGHCAQFCKKSESQNSEKRISVFHNIWPLSQVENREKFFYLLLRGMFGGGAVFLRFFALNYITIGDTAVIACGSPLIVTILAHFILKERTGIVPILMALFALGGVFIISRPPILTGQESFNTETLIGTGLAFGALVCTALNTILGRKIRVVQFSVQLLVSGGVGVVQSLVILMTVNRASFILPSDWKDLMVMVAIASLAFFVQLSMTLALKFETAAIVSLVRTCDSIFGFIVQFIFFAIAPDLFSYMGALFIMSGVFLSAFRKYLEELPKDGSSRLRSIFKFLLY